MTQPPLQADRNEYRFAIGGCVLLAIATLLLYVPAIRHSFIVFDDADYVTNNLHVQEGLTWNTFAWAWTSIYADNWHPLTWLSHALDCQLYGLNPTGHHLTSVLLHLANLVLLFWILARSTGARGRSLLVAALFALHPINVESVAWVAERKNVLCTFFFLLAIAAYGWYAAKPNVKRYLAVAFAFLLGLAAKPMVITLPFVFLILDYWPLQRVLNWNTPAPVPQTRKKSKEQTEPPATRHGILVRQLPFSRLVLEKLPLLSLSAGSAIITVFAQHAGGATRTLTKYPLWFRVVNALYAYFRYIFNGFWPTRLEAYYPPTAAAHLAAWQIILLLLFLGSVSFLAWKYRQSRSYLIAGWAWYLGTLVPVIGLVQVGDQGMADRYAYIPLIGIFVMVIWSLSDLADSFHLGLQPRIATSVVVLAVLAFLTSRQIRYWASEYDLWTHALAVTPDNIAADENLGMALVAMDRPLDALPKLRASVDRLPFDPRRHVNLAADLAQSERFPEAIQEYAEAIRLTPDPEVKIRCYESIATLYDYLGDFDNVRKTYEIALKVDPRQARSMADRLVEQIADESSGPRYLQLGILLEEAGQFRAARATFEQALKVDPSFQLAKQYLDAVPPDR